MPVGPPVQRVVDSYKGVPCTTLRPPNAPVRPGEPCGQIHEYCRGHIRGQGRDVPPPRLGDPCTARAISGATVCRNHGGTNGRVQMAAKRRLILEAEEGGELGELLARTRLAVGGRPQAEAIDDARDEVAAMVRALHAQLSTLPLESTVARTMVDGDMIVNVLVAGLTGPDHNGDLKPHPLVGLYGEWMDRLVKTEKVAHDMGIDERRLAIEEGHIDGIMMVLRGALTQLGVSWDDEGTEAAVVAQLRRQDAVETSGREPALLELDAGDGDAGHRFSDLERGGETDDPLAGTLFDGAP